MPSKITIPGPARAALVKLGRDIDEARRRRKLSDSDLAERMFVSRDTLWRMKRGDPAVSVGTVATALFILGLHGRLMNLADQTQDTVGLDLDRENLPQRVRKRKLPR